MAPSHPKVSQSEECMQLSSIFRKTSVAHLHKFELALDYPKRVLHLVALTGFGLLDSLADSFGLQLCEHPALARAHYDTTISIQGEPLLKSTVSRVGKAVIIRSMQKRFGLDNAMNISSVYAMLCTRPIWTSAPKWAFIPKNR